VEHSIFIFCGTIHSYILCNVFSDFCGMSHNLWPDFPKSQTPLYWSSKECSPIMKVKFTPIVQMVLLQCLSKRSDPKSVRGILYSGKWQENKDFLLTLFEPEAPTIIDYLEPPATQFDDLILEDDLSSGIHIHKSIFEHFHKQFKNFLFKGTTPSILSHYNARIRCLQVELVEYDKEYMRGLFNTMVEQGNYNKKTYNKNKMDKVREKVREICVMVDLNEDSNEED
jgi:hypothetical protein